MTGCGGTPVSGVTRDYWGLCTHRGKLSDTTRLEPDSPAVFSKWSAGVVQPMARRPVAVVAAPALMAPLVEIRVLMPVIHVTPEILVLPSRRRRPHVVGRGRSGVSLSESGRGGNRGKGGCKGEFAEHNVSRDWMWNSNPARPAELRHTRQEKPTTARGSLCSAKYLPLTFDEHHQLGNDLTIVNATVSAVIRTPATDGQSRTICAGDARCFASVPSVNLREISDVTFS
jgi:hypothetical protein